MLYAFLQKNEGNDQIIACWFPRPPKLSSKTFLI